MDGRSEKPKRRVGQRGGERTVFLVSYFGQASTGLFRGAYPFQALYPPPAPGTAATDYRCAHFMTDIDQATAVEQYR